MPRYRFVVADGKSSTDLIELPDLARARVEAVKTLGDLLRDEAEDFWLTSNCRVVLQNEDGLTLLEVEASGVIAPAGRAAI
jgi:hypothetical protein